MLSIISIRGECKDFFEFDRKILEIHCVAERDRPTERTVAVDQLDLAGIR
jgi:hypothetical protein